VTGVRKSSPSTGSADRRRGIRGVNRFSLRLFGPPSVGRYEGAYPPVDRNPPCASCGRLESEHETFRTNDGKTLRRCP
jgi:hypothetical protein